MKLVNTEVKIMVTSCPICYKVFKNDYLLNGMQVLPHSVFIDNMIKEGKLTLQPTDLKVAYHDPCGLGKVSGIYEQPHNVLKQLMKVEDIAEERVNSLCCGGTIGDLMMNAQQRYIICDSAIKTWRHQILIFW